MTFEFCGNKLISTTNWCSTEHKRYFWEYRDCRLTTVCNPSTYFQDFNHELIRRKAISIIEGNQILSKDRVELEDAINLVFILFQVGNLDLLSDPEDFQDHFCFQVDERTKKVSQLLVRNSSQTYNIPLQIPIDIVSSLDGLRDLKLSNINIPLPDSALKRQQQRSLRNLKKLDISFSKMDNKEAVLESRFFHLLPNLESIQFRLYTGRRETIYIRNVLNDIQSSFCAFQKTLRSVDLSYSMCTQDELKTLLVDVAPKIPNLHDINVSCNKIRSLKRIAECINSAHTSQGRAAANCPLQCQSSLQNLDLSWNPVMITMMKEPQEKAALMTILGTFKGLYTLGNNININEYPPDLRYQLRTNHAGRRLLDPCSICHQKLFTPLMPFLLERAFSKSQDIYSSYWRDERPKDPTGVYYLFRSGPILHAFLRNRLAETSYTCSVSNPRNDCYEVPRKRKRQKLHPSGSNCT